LGSGGREGRHIGLPTTGAFHWTTTAVQALRPTISGRRHRGRGRFDRHTTGGRSGLAPRAIAGLSCPAKQSLRALTLSLQFTATGTTPQRTTFTYSLANGSDRTAASSPGPTALTWATSKSLIRAAIDHGSWPPSAGPSGHRDFSSWSQSAEDSSLTIGAQRIGARQGAQVMMFYYAVSLQAVINPTTPVTISSIPMSGSTCYAAPLNVQVADVPWRWVPDQSGRQEAGPQKRRRQNNSERTRDKTRVRHWRRHQQSEFR